MKVRLKRRLTFLGVFLPSFLLASIVATIVKGVFEGISHLGGIIIQSVFTFLLMVCFLSIVVLGSLEKRINELEAEVKKKEE